MMEIETPSRRSMLLIAGGLSLAPWAAFAQGAPAGAVRPPQRAPIPPAAPVATAEERARAPVIKKTVVKVFNNSPRIKEPNDLEFAPNGDLWVLDQVDQPTNKVFTCDPATGAIKKEVLTEGLHASGITLGNGAWWIGSTKGDM